MSLAPTDSSAVLRPLQHSQVQDVPQGIQLQQSSRGLSLSSESPRRLSGSGVSSLDRPTTTQHSQHLSVRPQSEPSIERNASGRTVSIATPRERLREVEATLASARDAGIDEVVLEQLVSEREQLHEQLRNGPVATFKTEGLQLSDEASARLKQTLESRIGKQEKVKSNKAEGRKALKSKAEKFLKEFKGVFKNIGKLGKSVGDAAKGIREANVSGDSARLGGFDSSDAQKALSKTAIKGDGMSGQMGDMAKVTGGIAGATQLVETALDIYFLNAKIDKAEVDAQTIKDFSKAVTDLNQAKKELAQLRAKSGDVDQMLQEARDIGIDDVTIAEVESQAKPHLEALDAAKKKVADLTQKVNDSAIGKKLAEGDREKFYDDLGMEFAKLSKSLGDGLKAVIDISRIAVATGTAAAEGLKAASSTVGVIIGPLTCAINTKDGIKDMSDRRAAIDLGNKTSGVIKEKGIKQDDGELLAIAERVRLKQGKQKVDKGLSATKNFAGAAGGLASGFASAATIAAMATGAAIGVAAIATPIGWALAGTAALAAIGYGVYKLARHINSSNIKAALQTTLQVLEKQPNPKATLNEIRGGLSPEEAGRLDKVAAKAVAALNTQGIAKTAGELTVEELKNYASKKFLARDTGIATSALFQRFKSEVAAAFAPRTADQITKADMEAYLKDEKGKAEIGSAAGLINKLGSMSADDALLLLKTSDKGESNTLKFLSKKLKLV